MNVIGAHAQGFVVNDELLLRISEDIRTVHSLNTCSIAQSFQSVYSRRTAWRSYQ